MERPIGLIRRPPHDRRGDPRGGGEFSCLPATSVAGGGPARRRTRNIRPLHRGADAGLADHGSARRPAGIHQIVLGLSRSLGERCAHWAGPRALAEISRDLRCGGAQLRCRPLRHRRDLGRGDQLRNPRRRAPGDPFHGHARLRRPPAELFSRRISLGAGDSPARRCQARPPGRFLGGRVRADAIHADRVQKICRGFRPRWASRRGRLGARHHRLDRQQLEARRLGARANLGLRSGGAGEFQFSARRPFASDDDPRLGAPRACAPRRQTVPARRTTVHSC